MRNNFPMINARKTAEWQANGSVFDKLLYMIIPRKPSSKFVSLNSDQKDPG